MSKWNFNRLCQIYIVFFNGPFPVCQVLLFHSFEKCNEGGCCCSKTQDEKGKRHTFVTEAGCGLLGTRTITGRKRLIKPIGLCSPHQTVLAKAHELMPEQRPELGISSDRHAGVNLERIVQLQNVQLRKIVLEVQSWRHHYFV